MYDATAGARKDLMQEKQAENARHQLKKANGVQMHTDGEAPRMMGENVPKLSSLCSCCLFVYERYAPFRGLPGGGWRRAQQPRRDLHKLECSARTSRAVDPGMVF